MALLLCLAALSSATLAAADPPFDPHGLVLFDFESDGDLAGWQVRDLTGLESTERWSSHGRSAAAITYHAYEEGREEWPAIEVMTTAYDGAFGLERSKGRAMDIWVPLTPKFDSLPDRIAEAREQGRDIWWCICIGPQHPYAHWLVEYPAIEARLIMGAMTAKYRPGGFPYYAVSRWPVNKKVCEGAPRTDWDPASYKNSKGDGSVMVAGPNGPLATIRLENIRDGIEDYEYYLLLRHLVGGNSALAQVPDAVVMDLTHFTGDPQVLYRERQRVAEQIEPLTKGARS